MDLQKVKGSPPCAAVGASLEAEVGGVISIVRSLGKGVGPEAHTILIFSNFYKSCIKKLENCYWVQANVDDDGVFEADLWQEGVALPDARDCGQA